ERRQEYERQEEWPRAEADDAREREQDARDHQSGPGDAFTADAQPYPDVGDRRCERPNKDGEEWHREDRLALPQRLAAADLGSERDRRSGGRAEGRSGRARRRHAVALDRREQEQQTDRDADRGRYERGALGQRAWTHERDPTAAHRLRNRGRLLSDGPSKAAQRSLRVPAVSHAGAGEGRGAPRRERMGRAEPRGHVALTERAERRAAQPLPRPGARPPCGPRGPLRRL